MGVSTVNARLGADTKVSLQALQFNWAGDEPVAAGGTDTGPTPYEMLLASLTSCIALTLRLYARHKQIALDGVDVTAEFHRVHAADCEDCDERADGWIDRIQTRVTVHGEFTASQRKQLAQVASRCPVHKTLAMASTSSIPSTLSTSVGSSTSPTLSASEARVMGQRMERHGRPGSR